VKDHQRDRGKWENGGVHWLPMMLLERWVVVAVVGLTLPLVSTAGGAPAPQQAGDAQTAQSAKTGDDVQNPSKADDDQDLRPAKVDDDDQDQKPAKAEDDQDLRPAKVDDGQGQKPAKAADDQELRPAAKVDHDQDATPAKAADDLEPQPKKSGVEQNSAKAAAPTLARPPATAEEAKKQQLEKDTAELLRLVQELKDEVEKAGTNTLSLIALRKADEIQRLAKNLKERMKEEGQISQK
jgi:hypothetical protein